MAKQPLIAVIDGKGGGLGRAVIEALNRGELEGEIIALGTNAVATANMLRGGAKDGASGENAVCHMCRQAKVIVGPIGILTADAMMGEITPADGPGRWPWPREKRFYCPCSGVGLP